MPRAKVAKVCRNLARRVRQLRGRRGFRERLGPLRFRRTLERENRRDEVSAIIPAMDCAYIHQL